MIGRHRLRSSGAPPNADVTPCDLQRCAPRYRTPVGHQAEGRSDEAEQPPTTLPLPQHLAWRAGPRFRLTNARLTRRPGDTRVKVAAVRSVAAATATYSRLTSPATWPFTGLSFPPKSGHPT